MIFKLIDSNTSLSGKKLQGTMPFESVISAFKNKQGISYDSGFSESIDNDITAIKKFRDEVNNSTEPEDALKLCMTDASENAQNFAKNLDIVGNKVQLTDSELNDFVVSQRQLEVGNIALDKSFKNCSSIINEYNSNCQNVGITQTQFVEAVSGSNRVMGNYLNGLNGAKASFGGYIKSLAGAKLQTIGLQAASMALNAVIGIGIGLAISAALQGISKLIHYEDDLIQKSEDAANTIKSIGDSYKSAQKTVDDCTNSFIELSKGVDLSTGKNLTLSDEDYKEFLDISNELAETFPTLTRHYDENGNAIVQLNGDAETITSTLQELLKTERELANQEIIDNLPDLYKGIKTKSKQYEAEIDEYQNVIDGLSDIKNKTDKLTVSEATGSNIISYMGENSDEFYKVYDAMHTTLKELDYAYEELSLDYGKDGKPIGFNFKITDDSFDSSVFKDSLTKKIGVALDEAEKSLAASINNNKANWSGLISSISAYLQTSDNYTTLSDSAQSAIQTIINGIDYSSLNFKKWDDIKEYINDDIVGLFSDGNGDAITKFIDIQTKFNNNKCDVSDYQNALNEISDFLSQLDDEEKEKQFKIALGIEGDQDTLNRIGKNLDLENNKPLKDWINSLNSSQLEIIANLSTNTETADWDLKTWKEKVQGEMTINAALDFDAEATEENYENLQKAVQEARSNQYGMTETSRNTITSIFGEDSELFDRTATGIRLNTDRLNELQQEQEKIKRQNFNDALSELYKEYNELSGQIKNCGNITSDEYAKLVDSRNAIVDKINDVSNLQSEYEGLTSAYAEWQNALANGEDGDMYDNIRTEYEKAEELFNKNLVGTGEFESYMKLLTGKDWSASSFDEITQGWKDLGKEIGYTGYSIKDFLSEDEQGVMNFLKAASKLKDSGITEKDGFFTIDVGNTSELAEKLGVSTDLVESMFSKLRDYKFDIDFKNDTENLEILTTDAQKASESLRELGLTDVNFDFSTTDVDSLDTQLSEAKKLYDSLIGEDGEINMSAPGAEDIIMVYRRLLYQKEQLNSPIIMDVDISKIDSEDLASDIQELQNIVGLHNKIQVEAELGNDTSDLKQQLAEKIQEAGKDNSILVGMDINENTSYEDIQKKIDEWCKDSDNAQLLLDAGVDDSRLTDEADKIKEYIQNAVNGIKIDLKFDNKYLDNLFGGTISIDADTSEAEKNVEDFSDKKDEATKSATTNVNANVSNAINNLGKIPPLKASIGSGVTTKVDADTKQGTNKLNLFESIKNKIKQPARATVTADTSSASSKILSVLSYLRTIVGKTWTAIVSAKSSGTSAKDSVKNAIAGVHKLNGTVNGSAKASGDWGASKSETALMGEIAPELWVHSDIGTWELVESPQFRKVRKGDIIFNGDQTEDLIKRGVIDSFGKAFISGTAYKSGVSGGGKGISSSSSSSKSSSKSSSTKSSSSSSSSKSSSSSEDASDDFKETLDWIEIAIERIERAISSLDLKASSVYKSWSERTVNLKNQISEIGDEIDIQSKGYDRYIKQANSVGLSSSWAEKVRNGQIDINTITDEDLSDKIKEYQEWYEKALDCKEAIEELKETQADLYKQAFDNVGTQYDGILQVIDFQKSMIDEFISQSEEKGLITSTEYYDSLIKQETENINQLNKEKNALLNSLQEGMSSGLITKGSEAWYEMCNQIDEVTLSIEEANTSLLEYSNNIRDIQWQIFDLLQEKISQVTSESDFLIDLFENDKLYDDKGQLTGEGLSTMGLHGVNYNVYMAQADKYAKEMLEIDKQLAKDPYNQDLYERRQELLEQQQEMILAAEDEKEAIVDMVREGIEIELDALKELIDTYTDALDAQKDLYNYQKKVEVQTKEIASLQKQLSAYEGDSSEETKAKIQELKVSLDEAQGELEETEYDKYISDQKQLLDELYDEYEIILNARLDNIDALILDMVTAINDNAGIISSTLSDKVESVGYTLSDTMTSIWDTNNTELTSVLTTYGQNIVNGITSASTTVNNALNMINTNIVGMMAAIDKMAKTNTKAVTSSNSSKSSATTSSQANQAKSSSSSTSSTKHKSTSSSSSSGWGSWFIKKNDSYPKSKLSINTSIVDRLKYFNFDSSMSARKTYYSKMGGSGNYTGSPSQNVWMLNQMKSHGYKRGRYKLSQNEYAWTQEGRNVEAIIRPSDGAILTPLAKNDSVLNADATANLWGIANNPNEFIRNNLPFGAITTSPQNGGESNFNGNINFSINLPNVMNYEEFKYAIQRDRNFEKFVRSVSVDKMFGGSSLKKYNC